MLVVKWPSIRKVQDAPPATLWVAPSALLRAVRLSNRLHQPSKAWLSGLDYWPEVISKRCKDPVLRDLLYVAFNARGRYGKSVPIFSYTMYKENPGLIIDRVLRSIGLRSKKPEKILPTAPPPRKEPKVYKIDGVVIPVHGKFITTKYFPSQQLAAARHFEKEALKGVPDVPASLEVDTKVSSGTLSRSNAVRKPASEGKPYKPPALRGKVVGGVCPTCKATYRRGYRPEKTKIRGYGQSGEDYTLHPKLSKLDANSYYHCWMAVESGLWTAGAVRDYFPTLATVHRCNVAQERYDGAHPVECNCRPRVERAAAKGLKLTL